MITPDDEHKIILGQVMLIAGAGLFGWAVWKFLL